MSESSADSTPPIPTLTTFERKYPVYLTAAEIHEVFRSLEQVECEYSLIVGLHTPQCPEGQGDICYHGTHSREEIHAAYQRGDALIDYFRRLAKIVPEIEPTPKDSGEAGPPTKLS